MNAFVLDCSVAMAWAFDDEADAYADAVLDLAAESRPICPSVWPVEVANVLLVGERRNRLKKEDSERFLRFLRDLMISIDEESGDRALDDTLNLARDHGLSAYDASYLELAIRKDAPLATLDRRLCRIARSLGVAVAAGKL